MAAQCIKQMQVLNQIQKGAEFANGNALRYKAETEYLRAPAQMMQEKRLCEAASNAAMAEFMFHTEHMMSPADKLKTMSDPVLKAYKQGIKDFEGNRPAALSKAIEADIKRGKDPLSADHFSRATRDVLQTLEGKTPERFLPTTLEAETLKTQMFSRVVSDKQMAAVACAGLLPEDQQGYTLNKTMKSADFRAVSDKRAEDMKSVIAGRRQAVEAAARGNANASGVRQAIAAQKDRQF